MKGVLVLANLLLYFHLGEGKSISGSEPSDAEEWREWRELTCLIPEASKFFAIMMGDCDITLEDSCSDTLINVDKYLKSVCKWSTGVYTPSVTCLISYDYTGSACCYSNGNIISCLPKMANGSNRITVGETAVVVVAAAVNRITVGETAVMVAAVAVVVAVVAAVVVIVVMCAKHRRNTRCIDDDPDHIYSQGVRYDKGPLDCVGVDVPLYLMSRGCGGGDEDKDKLLCGVCWWGIGELDAMKKLVEQYKVDPKSTPLTKEDSDALEKLLIDIIIKVPPALRLLRFDQIQQLLRDKCHKDLAAKLRTQMDEGKSLKVTKKSQEFSNFGIKVTVPENCLPEGIDECDLHISCDLSADFEAPANTKLFSLIYRFTCEPKLQFMKALTVEIKHCGILNPDVLVFARETDHGQKFEILDGGDFPIGKCYGSIQVTQFSWYGIFRRSFLEYCALLFCRKDSACEEIHVKCVICWNLHDDVKVIKEALKCDGFETELELDGIRFETEIEMEIENSQPDLNMKTPPTLSKESIDGYCETLRSPNRRRAVIPAIYCKANLNGESNTLSTSVLLKNLLFGERRRLSLNISLPQQQLQVQQKQPLLEVQSDNFSACYWNIDKYAVQSEAGRGVLVAVLDTGINVDHCTFRYQNKSKIKFGKNFVTDEEPCTKLPYWDQDPNSHGTGVASVIVGRHIMSEFLKASSSQNDYILPEKFDKLCLGVASKASLVVCRIATEAPKPEYVAEALKWIHEHNDVVMKYDPEKQKGDPYCNDHKEGCKLSHEDKKKDKISIVNMSFRLTDDDPKIKEHIINLNKQNVICVAGSGNDGNNRDPGYPALYENVLSVGAVDKHGQIARFSTCPVDVHALGKHVFVAAANAAGIIHVAEAREQQPPPGENLCPPPPAPPTPPLQSPPPAHGPLDYSFKHRSGTSFATPAVSGLIAILLQRAREKDQDGLDLSEHICNVDILRKLFAKHLLITNSDKPELKLLQPQKIEQFFKYNINNLDHVIQDLLASI